MMQGDSYNLGIRILNNARSPVTPDDIIDIEMTIGHLRKTYRKSQIFYDNGRWFFPLSQKETFSLSPTLVKAQVRVLWSNGVMEGKTIRGIRVNESMSKEAL